MKSVILRCEDDARLAEATASLLEGARLSHLQQLAQAGAAGLIGRPRHDAAIDRLHLHQALLGLQPDAPETAPAWWYAQSLGVEPAADETAWCCELMTQQDGRVIDVTAGHITTTESHRLIQALNERFESRPLRWIAGQGSHHVLMASASSFEVDGALLRLAPEALLGQRWTIHVPKGPMGEALQTVMDEASSLLEAHPVNRVRVDLGENPANLVWLWGPASRQPQRSSTERSGGPGAMISTSFPMRGLARVLGWSWHEGPSSFEDASLRSLSGSMETLLARHDQVYVHLRIGAVDPVQRLCAMERIDQLVLKPLTERLPRQGPWRLLVAVDDQVRQRVPFVAIGTGLPQQPVTHLSADALAGTSLVFEDAEALHAWFTQRQETGDRGQGKKR